MAAQSDDSKAIERIRLTRPFVQNMAAPDARRTGVPGNEPVLTSATIPDGVRRLCAAVDIAGWSTRTRGGERDEATRVVHGALRMAGDSVAVPIDDWNLHPAGDGGLIVFPAEIDESAMIAALTRTLTADLAGHNQDRANGERLRVRLSIAQGTLHKTPFGFSDDVTIGVARLVDCSVLRAALAGYPASDLALIVSEDVFHDVIAHERHGLDARSFWPVVAADKTFQAPAWIHVPDRTGGPQRPPGADHTRQESSALQGPGPLRIAGLMPLLLPGWLPVPAATPPEERIDPAQVAAALDAWRGGVAEPAAAQAMPEARVHALLRQAGELVERGRGRSAFDLVAARLADAPGTRSLASGLARVLVHAEPGRHADAVRELLDWLLVHRVESVTDTLEPLLLRAENSYAIGHLQSAVIDLSQLLQVLPGPTHEPGPAALLRLGDCLAQLGDTAGAAAAWERLLAARPVHPHAPLRLGYLALTEDRPADADRQLQRAEHFLHAGPAHGDPRPVEHAVALGQYAVHRANREDVAAEHCLDAAANLQPDDPVTAAEQAILAADKGDTRGKHRFTQLAVTRAACARNGLPVLDLLHDLGLLDDDQHRQACTAHRERHSA